MTVRSNLHPSRSARPFGDGLKDADLRLVVASIDVRYRQRLQAILVRRKGRDVGFASSFDVELIVLGTVDNIEELKREAFMLDPDGRLDSLVDADLVDLILTSSVTGEKVMITSAAPIDYKRIEQIAGLEQIHIGGKEDRGSWVCRVIDAERLDALFGGRLIDIRSESDS